MADSRSYEIQLVEMLRAISRAVGNVGVSSGYVSTPSSSQSINFSEVTVAVNGIISRLDTFKGYMQDLEDKLEYDPDHDAFHFKKSIYSDGFVTAGGVGSGGGGGGGGDLDFTKMWASLQSTYAPTTAEAYWNDFKIGTLHLPDLIANNGLTAQYQASGSGASLDVDLVLGISSIQTSLISNLASYDSFTYYYKKTEVDSLIGAINQFKYEIYPTLGDITSPASNVLYLIGPTGSGADRYEEYVYANSTFTKIGDTSIDLSGYVTTQALGSWAGSTYITTLGTITTGVWNGSAIANSYLANSAITINGSSTSLGGSFNTASITAGTAGTSSATSGYTLAVPYVTMNQYGIVTGYGTHTHTVNNIPNSSLVNSSLTIGSTSISLGGTSTTLAGLTSVTSQKFYLDSNTYFELDSNGYVHLVHPTGKGFYADGFITAGGVGSGGGGGGGTGLDVTAMYANLANATGTDSTYWTREINVSHLHEFWKSLQNNDIVSTYDNYKIAGSHIPDMAETYGYLKSVNIDAYLQSLQSQIDSVASRSDFDELVATTIFGDQISASSGYIENIFGALSGNATTASYLSSSTYAKGGEKNPVYFSGGLAVASTTTEGSASVPVYLNAGTITACTGSNVFSSLSSSAATNLSITIAGQNRTATLYATYNSAGENISDKFSIISTTIKSLQSQIDSVAAKISNDEVYAGYGYFDMLSIGSAIGGNLSVIGTIYSNVGIYSSGYVTAGAAASSSDARLKEHISTISYERALDILLRFRGCEWDWNGKKEYLAGKHGSGLIAQEVQGIMPWAVLDLNGEYSLNYNSLWGIAIPVMQNHEQRIKELEAEVERLKNNL